MRISKFHACLKINLTRDNFSRSADGILVSIVLCDHEDLLRVLLCKFDDFLPILKVVGDRFLHDDVLALCQGGFAHFIIELNRQRNYYGINILLEQIGISNDEDQIETTY